MDLVHRDRMRKGYVQQISFLAVHLSHLIIFIFFC